MTGIPVGATAISIKSNLFTTYQNHESHKYDVLPKHILKCFNLEKVGKKSKAAPAINNMAALLLTIKGKTGLMFITQNKVITAKHKM